MKKSYNAEIEEILLHTPSNSRIYSLNNYINKEVSKAVKKSNKDWMKASLLVAIFVGGMAVYLKPSKAEIIKEAKIYIDSAHVVNQGRIDAITDSLFSEIYSNPPKK